jgi:hypothetical protein
VVIDRMEHTATAKIVRTFREVYLGDQVQIVD